MVRWRARSRPCFKSMRSGTADGVRMHQAPTPGKCTLQRDSQLRRGAIEPVEVHSVQMRPEAVLRDMMRSFRKQFYRGASTTGCRAYRNRAWASTSAAGRASGHRRCRWSDGLEDLLRFATRRPAQPAPTSNMPEWHRSGTSLAGAGVDWLDHHATVPSSPISTTTAIPDLIALDVSDGVLVMENDGSRRKLQPWPPPNCCPPRLMPTRICIGRSTTQDGDLDFFVCCYNRRAGAQPPFHVFARPVPYHDANNGGRNVLFRNDGRWRFTET